MLALPCGHLLGRGGNIALCGLFQLTDTCLLYTSDAADE